jgi:hypothetical protein
MPHYYIQRYTIDVAVQDFGPTGAPPPDFSSEITSALEDNCAFSILGMEIDDHFIRVDGSTVKLSKDAGTPAKKEVA